MSEMRQKYQQWQYYVIIGVMSFISVVFLPFLGSDPEMGWNLPATASGWVVYVITKLIMVFLNLMIFHCFMQQAKINVKDNPYYIEANEILRRYSLMKKYVPMGPDEWTKKEYGVKGIMVGITTLLSAVAITQAVLSFDWIMMLTYLFTIIMGIICGIFQMNNAEGYWTGEYWQYAKMIEKKYLNKEQKCSKEVNK